MASRTARFLSTIFASMIAGAPLAIMSPGAADDCLPGPNGASPQGQHWFYRLEKETKRKCWYLRTASERTAAPRAKVAAEPPPKPEASHPVEDAHAELTAPPPVVSPPVKATISAPPPPPTRIAPAPTAQAFPTPAANPEQQADASAPGTEIVDAAPSVSVSSASGEARRKKLVSASSVIAASAAAEPASQKPAGSLQTLLLVMVGALGLAGLIASLVYRFGGIARLRLNADDGEARRINWDAAAVAGRTPWRDQTVPMMSPSRAPESWHNVADEYDVVHEPEDFVEAAPPAQSELDVDQITEMLERLVQQGPQLDAPIAAAGSADRGRNWLDRPAVRA